MSQPSSPTPSKRASVLAQDDDARQGSKRMSRQGSKQMSRQGSKLMSRQASKDSITMRRESSKRSRASTGRLSRRSSFDDLPDERVVIVGGMDGPSQHDTTETYSSKFSEFTPGLQLAQRRWGCSSALLDGVRHLIVGGSDGYTDHDSTEVVDPNTNSVVDGPRLRMPRSGCATTRLNDNYVMVVGGYAKDSTELLLSPLPPPPDPDAEEGSQPPGTPQEGQKPVEPAIDFANDLFFFHGPRLQRVRACSATVALEDSRVLVIGGYDRHGTTDTTEIADFLPVLEQDPEDINTGAYDLEKKVHFVSGPKLSCRRAGCVAVNFDEDKVLVIGGSDGKSKLKSTEFLDLETMTFSPGPTMGTERAGCTVSPLNSANTKFLVIGGQDSTPGGYLSTTEILEYDEEDDNNLKFRPGPDMDTRRAYATSLRYIFTPAKSSRGLASTRGSLIEE